MRGLLGDATEEFIESLDKKEGEASDDEMTYGLASVLGECGGLKVIFDTLAIALNPFDKFVVFLSLCFVIFFFVFLLVNHLYLRVVFFSDSAPDSHGPN
jgi:hypothetical protein